MSKMLNKFVKIIEQVDPDQQRQQERQQNSDDEFHLDDENDSATRTITVNDEHQQQQDSTGTKVGFDSDNNNEVNDSSNGNQNYQHQQEEDEEPEDELTEHDISDPFVAEYQHRNKKPSKLQHQQHESESSDEKYHQHQQQLTSSSSPVGANSPLPPFSPITSSDSTHHRQRNQNQQQLLLDSSSHYLNYLNNTGSFDLSTAVASGDVKALLERIAALETAISQSNYERQVLQCRLEKSSSGVDNVEKDDTDDNLENGSNNNNNINHSNIRHLKQSLVEQIEKNDALAREFQGRVVQLEYELLTAKRELSEELDERKRKSKQDDEEQKSTRGHIAISVEDQQKSKEGEEEDTTSSTIDEFKNTINQLEFRLRDSQRKNDVLQKKAADALEKSQTREKLLQADLDLAQSEVEKMRRRLLEIQKPIDHQLEDQLQKTPMFEKIHHTGWGLFVTNLMGSIDRIGVNIGRFFANHAMIRFFFIVYVICLHIYIFHLFAVVLHHLETQGDDVHEHLNRFHSQHGASKP